MISRLTLAAVAVVLPSVVQAQAYQCSTPASVEH
jgi:ribonuclease T2